MEVKALVLYSGGLDSTCLLYQAVKRYGKMNVYVLNITYGSKHNSIERECAQYHVNKLGLESQYIEHDISHVFEFTDCSLLKHSTKDVPDGTYEEQQGRSETPVDTYVPYRNGLFISVAVSIAYQLNIDHVYLAVHKGDTVAAAYPDCTPQFIIHQCRAAQVGTSNKVSVFAPFVKRTKEEVAQAGYDAGMTEEDFNNTHSCYKGIKGGCGTCATCIERNNALKKIFHVK